MKFDMFSLSANGKPVFLVSPHLLSPEREAEYLSKLAETLLFFLWPKSYGKCAPVRHLLKGIHLDYVFCEGVTTPICHVQFVTLKTIPISYTLRSSSPATSFSPPSIW